MYHNFIHSSVSGHLGCFHVVAIVNRAAMNMWIHVGFFELLTWSILIAWYWWENRFTFVFLLKYFPTVSFSKVEKNMTSNLYIIFAFICSCLHVFIQQIFMEAPLGNLGDQVKVPELRNLIFWSGGEKRNVFMCVMMGGNKNKAGKEYRETQEEEREWLLV